MAKRTTKVTVKNATPPDLDLDPTQIKVELRPIAGVEPLVYVPILWSSVLLALIIWLFFLPGARGHGSFVEFTSNPAGAMVVVNELRIGGSTPVRTFVPAGTHTVQTILPNGTSDVRPYTVNNRRLGVRIFPSRERLHIDLTVTDAASVIDQFLPRFAAWALTGRPSAQFQMPWIAATFAGLVPPPAPSPSGASSAGDAAQWLREFLGHANSRPQTADVLRAATILSTTEGAITPASIADIVRFFVQLENTSHGFDRLVHGVLASTDDATAVAINRWANAAQTRRDTELLTVSLELDEIAPPASVRRTLAGQNFALIPGGNYITDYPVREESTVGVPVHIAPFWITAQAITRADYLAFLIENERWRPDNRDPLRAESLVGSDYLTDWDLITWRDTLAKLRNDRATVLGAWWQEPLSGISWHAAQAYVDWFATRYNVTARLPHAIEWEYAAFWNESGSLGLRNMGGTSWEWTNTWYAAHSFLFGASAPRDGDFRVVAGGPTRGRDGAPLHTSKGALPPEWSPQTTTFRLVVESL